MAALLSDQIDRLNQRTRSIKAAASNTAHSDAPTRISRPFTHAVLYAEIGQLIRDIDATELGLFALVQRKYDGDVQETQLKRVDFVGATPLKRNAARREEKAPEIAPEEYAQAALRCLHRYQKIRPMPRATKQLSQIIHQLQERRQHIAKLEAALKEQKQIDAPMVEKSNLKAEEESIQQLHERLAELNERKKRLQSRKGPKPKPTLTKPPKPALPTSPLEDKFWGTPGNASRTLNFSADLLIDEEADFNDLTNDASFSMPSPEKDAASGVGPSLHFEEADPPLAPIPAPASPEPPAPTLREVVQVPETPIREPSVVEEEPVRPTPKAKSDSVRVNAEVDRITTKIAAIYGDLLALAQEDSRKPSSPKDVIACLRTISAQTPSPDSPSQSSLSNANSQTPSAQEILTAFLLMQLLLAPGHTIPLNKLKDLLSGKSKSDGITVGALGQNPTRILYGCVGKRLVKIDRSGGEQLVKFDC